MEYRETSAHSYTPRRKETKIQAYGGLQLKTRNLDDQPQNNERQRRNSQALETEFNQQDARRQSKRRDSMPSVYTNSKYSYEIRQDQIDRRESYTREDEPLRELLPVDNRQPKRYEVKDTDKSYKPRDMERQLDVEKDNIRGSYVNHRRNQMILNKRTAREEPNKPLAASTGPAANKSIDPQLVQKLYSISKLNSRISERLKNMSAAMEKFRV